MIFNPLAMTHVDGMSDQFALLNLFAIRYLQFLTLYACNAKNPIISLSV